MMYVMLAAMVCGQGGKPTVPLEESCRRAAAVVVVEPAAEAGKYLVLDVLQDSTDAGLKKDTVIAVDLKGMVYEKKRAYILFLQLAGDAGRYQAAPQMRTEDGKGVRAQVQKLLATRQDK